MHTELRVRTVCELSLNEEFYLQPHTVSLLDKWLAKIHCQDHAVLVLCMKPKKTLIVILQHLCYMQSAKTQLGMGVIQPCGICVD